MDFLTLENIDMKITEVLIQKKPFDVLAKRPILVERVEEGIRTPDPQNHNLNILGPVLFYICF